MGLYWLIDGSTEYYDMKWLFWERDELLLRRSETLGYSRGPLCFYQREGGVDSSSLVRYHRWDSVCEIALDDLACKGWNGDAENWKERERKKEGRVSIPYRSGGEWEGDLRFFFLRLCRCDVFCLAVLACLLRVADTMSVRDWQCERTGGQHKVFAHVKVAYRPKNP